MMKMLIGGIIERDSSHQIIGESEADRERIVVVDGCR